MHRTFRGYFPAAVVAGTAALLATPAHPQNDVLTAGVWMETANYPASSVMRFEMTKDGLVGRYVQVSAPQKHWGFSVGEAVIRGKFNGDTFEGQVLLKQREGAKTPCNALEAGWQPISMKQIEPGKMYGAWQQAITLIEGDKCLVVRWIPQPYGLEQLQVTR